LDKPNFDTDKGQEVYAIQDGDIIDNANGLIVIKHTTPLMLKENGVTIKGWYSMYGHLTNRTTNPHVFKGEKIGNISNIGANNNHLHFCIFRKYGGAKTDAISPYWLPGAYSDGKNLIYADDADGTRVGADGTKASGKILYDDRIFLKTPSK